MADRPKAEAADHLAARINRLISHARSTALSKPFKSAVGVAKNNQKLQAIQVRKKIDNDPD